MKTDAMSLMMRMKAALDNGSGAEAATLEERLTWLETVVALMAEKLDTTMDATEYTIGSLIPLVDFAQRAGEELHKANPSFDPKPRMPREVGESMTKSAAKMAMRASELLAESRPSERQEVWSFDGAVPARKGTNGTSSNGS